MPKRVFIPYSTTYWKKSTISRWIPSPCKACHRGSTPTSSRKWINSSKMAPSSRLEIASTACFFHNRRAMRLSSRRANRQSSRSTRFVVTSSWLCIVGLLLPLPLPVVEGQLHVKRIPYVGLSGTQIYLFASVLSLMYDSVKRVPAHRRGTHDTKGEHHGEESWAAHNPPGPQAQIGRAHV